MNGLRTHLRPPSAGDLYSLQQAEKLCFSAPWPAQAFVSELWAPGRFNRLVLDPDGQLVAYLFAAWQYLDLHVLKVATLPAHRRCGLARELMRLAEEHTRGSGGETVTLEVRVGNLAAAAMYRSLDYEVRGRRPGYYADGEDAIVMTKRVAAGAQGD